MRASGSNTLMKFTIVRLQGKWLFSYSCHCFPLTDTPWYTEAFFCLTESSTAGMKEKRQRDGASVNYWQCSQNQKGLHLPRWYFTTVQAPWNSTGEFVHSNTTTPSRWAPLLMPSYTAGNIGTGLSQQVVESRQNSSGNNWCFQPQPYLREHIHLNLPWESKLNSNNSI